MSQPLLCAVCFGIDSMEQDGETGDMLCHLCGSLSQQFREEDAEVCGAGAAPGGSTLFRREAHVAHHRLQELKETARKEQEAAAKSIPEQAEALCEHYCRGLQQVLEAQCEALRAHGSAPAALPQVARSLWLQTLVCSRVDSRGWPGAVWAGEKERQWSNSSNRQDRVRRSVHRFARKKGPLPPLVEELPAPEGEGEGQGEAEGDAEGDWDGGEGEEEDVEEPREEGQAGQDDAGEAVEEAEGAREGFGAALEGSERWELTPAREEGDALVSPGAVEHVGSDERATVSDEWKGMMRELGRSSSPLMLIRHQLRRVLPLGTTLRVLFLACHWLRLPLLPWDLCRMASCGQLPFWRAWEDLGLEGFQGFPAPLSARILFMPHPNSRATVSARALELAAARLAGAVLQMELPQVNAPALARRFLRELGLDGSPELRGTVLRVVAEADGLFCLCATPEQLPARVLVMAAVLLGLKLHSSLGLASALGPLRDPGAPLAPEASTVPQGSVGGSAVGKLRRVAGGKRRRQAEASGKQCQARAAGGVPSLAPANFRAEISAPPAETALSPRPSSSSWLLQRLLAHLGDACAVVAPEPGSPAALLCAERPEVGAEASSGMVGAVPLQIYLQQVREGPLGVSPGSGSGSQVPSGRGSLSQAGDVEGGTVQGCLWGAFCEAGGAFCEAGGAFCEAGGAFCEAGGAFCEAGGELPDSGLHLEARGEAMDHGGASSSLRAATVRTQGEAREHWPAAPDAAQHVLEQMRRGDFMLAGLADEAVAGSSLCSGTGAGAIRGKGSGYVVYARASQRIPRLALHADFFVALHACARLIGVHERALLHALFLLEDRVLPGAAVESQAAVESPVLPDAW